MQISTVSSFLAWENISNLPLPEDVKTITKAYNWSEFLWSCRGLPMPFARYSLLDGKILYLEALSDGSVKVNKVEFTGEISVGGYFVDEKKEVGSNYLLIFKVTLVKGEVIEVVLEKSQAQSLEDYDKAYQKYMADFKKKFKRINSWWFIWLYTPYAYVVRCFLFVFIVLFSYLRLWLIKLSKFLTPY